MQKYTKLSDFSLTVNHGVIRDNKEGLEKAYSNFIKKFDLEKEAKNAGLGSVTELFAWNEFSRYLFEEGLANLLVTKRKQAVLDKVEELRKLDFEEISDLAQDRIDILTKELKTVFKEISWDDDIALIYRIKTFIYAIENYIDELMSLDNVEEIDDFLILVLLEDQSQFIGKNVLHHFAEKVNDISNIEYFNLEDYNIVMELLRDFSGLYIRE